jgi:hypothetical protein
LPTHSDELARVPGHVFQSAPEAWLTAAAPHGHAHAHTHRHQQHQHAAVPIYVPTPASHQQASYGTPPGAEAYTTFVASSMGAPSLSTPTPGPGQGQDGNVDIWHTVPSGYELEDWDTYISSVSGLAHSHPHPTQAHTHPHSHSSARSTHLPASTVAGGSGQGPVH